MKLNITKNTITAILALVVLVGLIWMIVTIDKPYVQEGFLNHGGIDENLSNYGYVREDSDMSSSKKELFKNSIHKPRSSKLAKLTKHNNKSKRNTNNSKHNTNKKGNKKGNKLGALKNKEEYMNVIRLLDTEDDGTDNDGKYDNFQDVLDEIDKIDVTAFGINSMGNTVRRYSKNIDKRLKYAHKKNSNSRVDASMAQLSVLTDEFRKLFAIDKLI